MLHEVEPLQYRSEHPRPAVFRRMVQGQASPEEARGIVRHLLAGCPSCGRLAEEARWPERREWNYDAVFDRLQQRLDAGIERLKHERATAPELYAELLGHEAVAGLVQVQSTRRYASLALCELLLEKSRELGADDPWRAEEAARLAAAAAEQLDLDLYGAPVVQDLRALAWAYFADARRARADLRSAENSLALAERLLAEGSGDPLARTELLTLKASLRSHGGRFEEALQLLNRVASLYRRLEERHLLGRTLVKKGTVLGNAGSPRAAVRLIRRGIDLIDPSREPRLLVCATHNLIWFLHESGRVDEAASCLGGARRLYRCAGDRPHLGRLRWLEGKLAAGLPAAEQALLDARDELAREGLSYEAALAAMDLAVLYANSGRGPEMRRQVRQMLPLFKTEDMYRETTVALLAFQQGGAERGPAELVDELGGYLRRARSAKNPPGLVAAGVRGSGRPLGPGVHTPG
jgi:tetratricopeptide (TPR) repeat protein